MSPLDHTPDWIDIAPQVIEQQEDHVPILGDQGELEIPPRGTFEDQLVYSHTWQTYRDFSPITASDVSDSYDSPGDDDIPDFSDREIRYITFFRRS